MAHHASAEKRIRQTIKRTLRNKLIRTTARTYMKRVREAIEKGDVQEADKALLACTKQVDKAVSKGVYHRNTGSRYISRLSAQVAALKRGGGAP